METRARVILVLGALLVAAGISEVVLRLVFRAEMSLPDIKTGLGYRFDPGLGWFPGANSRKTISGSRVFVAAHNSHGFRDAEPVMLGKPGIMVLGDSLVWGFDVGASERFTEKLGVRHPEWAIYNCGVSGYGTDQEFLLQQKYLAHYRPRVVFLVICGDNDNEDNAWNFRGEYYKPWFTFEAGRLVLHGVPVPRSYAVLCSEHNWLSHIYLARLCARCWQRVAKPPPRRNPDPPTGVLLLEMRRSAVEHGARFAVGLQHSNVELEAFLKKFGIPFVSLEGAQAYPTFGRHWTPEGHAFVAAQIEPLLARAMAASAHNRGSP